MKTFLDHSKHYTKIDRLRDEQRSERRPIARDHAWAYVTNEEIAAEMLKLSLRFGASDMRAHLLEEAAKRLSDSQVRS